MKDHLHVYTQRGSGEVQEEAGNCDHLWKVGQAGWTRTGTNADLLSYPTSPLGNVRPHADGCSFKC